MNEAIFAFIVLMAALAVVFDIYGEAVLVGAFFIILWQFAQFLGPSPIFAAYVIMIAAVARIIMIWFYKDWSDERKQFLTTTIDETLTRREQDTGFDHTNQSDNDRENRRH